MTKVEPEEGEIPISTTRPSTPPSRRVSRPIDEARGVLATLYPAELADVVRYAERLRAARGEVPDPDLLTRLRAVLLRLSPQHRCRQGVPLSVVRVELAEVPRVVLDRALLEVLRLVAENPGAAFVEAVAGIPSGRGLLYYCAAVRG